MLNAIDNNQSNSTQITLEKLCKRSPYLALVFEFS